MATEKKLCPKCNNLKRANGFCRIPEFGMVCTECRLKWRKDNEPGFREYYNSRCLRARKRRLQDPKKKKHVKEYMSKYLKHRYHTDPEFKERTKKIRKASRLKHKDRHNETYRKYMKSKRSTDVNYRLRQRLRIRLHQSLKGGKKLYSAIKDLGCTLEEFRSYIESKFQPGMTWDNWGLYGWHIDHIRPLSSFDLTDPEQYKQAIHYTNMQPLWAIDNLLKGNKVL